MSTDFRALCAELVNEVSYLGSLSYDQDPDSDLLNRARAALAQPEAEGPTDEELPPRPLLHPAVDRPDLVRYGLTWDGSPGKPLLTPRSDGYWTPWRVAARLPQPIPIAEWLPGEGDCCGNPRNGEGQWCWGRERPKTAAGTPVVWRLMRIDCLAEEAVEWMPWWALPLPPVTMPIEP